ncbi:MAG: hypothetical protein KC589_09730 [Nanoarchaeota archaeon]|nr:hypothetical protein [Nanoarchaeota archaeon]
MEEIDFNTLVTSVAEKINNAIKGLLGSVPKALGFEYKLEKKGLDIEIVFHSNFSGSQTIYIEFLESKKLFNFISDKGEFKFDNIDKLTMHAENLIDDFIDLSFKEMDRKRA